MNVYRMTQCLPTLDKACFDLQSIKLVHCELRLSAFLCLHEPGCGFIRLWD